MTTRAPDFLHGELHKNFLIIYLYVMECFKKAVQIKDYSKNIFNIFFFVFRTCVLITLAAQIEVPYKLGKNNYTGYINIPWNTTNATGSCDGNQLQTITLSWLNNLNVTNNVTFVFERANINSTKFDLAKINIEASPDNSTLPGYNGNFISLFSFTSIYKNCFYFYFR